MKKAFLPIFASLLLLFSNGYAQSSCEQTVKNISNVKLLFQNLPEAAKNPQWKNLEWINSNLGFPTENKIVAARIYEWKDFSLMTWDGVTREIQGKFPDENQKLPPVTEAVQLLGTPTAIKNISLREITWNCPGGSSLRVISDEKGDAIKRIEAVSCTSTGCGVLISTNDFATIRSLSDAMPPTTQPSAPPPTSTTTETTVKAVSTTPAVQPSIPTTPTSTTTETTVKAVSTTPTAQ